MIILAVSSEVNLSDILEHLCRVVSINYNCVVVFYCLGCLNIQNLIIESACLLNSEEILVWN